MERSPIKVVLFYTEVQKIPVSLFLPPVSNGYKHQVVPKNPPGKLTEMSDARRGLHTASSRSKPQS